MAKGIKAKSIKPSRADVTRRVLVRATSAAIRKASEKAMEVSGFVIQAKDGWVVQLEQDGRQTRLSQIDRVKRPAKLNLD